MLDGLFFEKSTKTLSMCKSISSATECSLLIVRPLFFTLYTQSSRIKGISKLRQNVYNLKNVHVFKSRIHLTKRYGLKSIAYRTNHFRQGITTKI